MVRYVLNEKQMQEIDRRTIEQIGIPSMVLMERASMAVAAAVEELLQGKNGKVLAICGIGGNGGDAVAAARMLHLKGYKAEVYTAWEQESKKLHPSMEQQMAIAVNCGVPVLTRTSKEIDFSAYDVIVDGLFGVGLTREITDGYTEYIRRMNESGCKIVAVDIPSGIHAGTGVVMGTAVQADVTVTFGERKIGQLLYPGAGACGELRVCDIGFPEAVTKQVLKESTYRCMTYDAEDVKRLPERRAYSNKGTYGRVLVIAGSKEITGAAYLCTKAAYQMGVGLVKLLSEKECVACVRTQLPEALMSCLEESRGVQKAQIEKEIGWADVVVAGPGIGISTEKRQMLDWIIKAAKTQKKPLLLDADALNLLAEDEKEVWSASLPAGTVLTPHLKELSRLEKRTVAQIAGELIDTAKQCTYNNELVYVIKDARTLVASGSEIYINTSGCDGMATGGSGDVLAGVIGGLMVAMPPAESAYLGVYLHGIAGERAAQRKGKRAMLARDILDACCFE